MNVKLIKIFSKIMAVMRSRRGHNLLVLLVFLGISTVLWFVLALNDEEQCDIRMPFRITNIPDSVTLVSTPPSHIAVSIRIRGSQRLKLSWGAAPTMNIDFRMYRSRNSMKLTSADLKAAARSAIDGASVMFVLPDSLNLYYTYNKGVELPVVVDYSATAGPRSSIVGRPHISVDSVKVFSVKSLPSNIKSVTTEPIRLSGIDANTTVKARLVAPPNSRVFPDSVDVTFDVEPLIFKSRKVIVEAINVPAGLKLITFPAQIDVMYMIPMSDYKISEPRMRVVADYRSLDHSGVSKKIKLRISDVSPTLRNVHLPSDSAEYIIERL